MYQPPGQIGGIGLDAQFLKSFLIACAKTGWEPWTNLRWDECWMFECWRSMSMHASPRSWFYDISISQRTDSLWEVTVHLQLDCATRWNQGHFFQELGKPIYGEATSSRKHFYSASLSSYINVNRRFSIIPWFFKIWVIRDRYWSASTLEDIN